MFMIIFDPILYYLVNEREMGEGICSRQLNLGWILAAEGEDGSKMEQYNANWSFVGWLEVTAQSACRFARLLRSVYLTRLIRKVSREHSLLK